MALLAGLRSWGGLAGGGFVAAAVAAAAHVALFPHALGLLRCAHTDDVLLRTVCSGAGAAEADWPCGRS